MSTGGSCFGPRGVVSAAVVVLLGCYACQTAEMELSLSESAGVETWGTSDMEFRRIARVRPEPGYPTMSFEMNRQGVVVAEVVAGEEGRVEQVRVLEAPDAHMEDEVRGALERWEIDPPVDEEGRAVRLRAKLFFYFVVENGKGVVRSPAEMLRESGQGAIDGRVR